MYDFSIPYNNDITLLDQLSAEFPDKIQYCREIYFAISNKVMGTGRTLSQSEYYDQEIKFLIQKAKKYDIKSNMLLNPACLGGKMADPRFLDKIIEYLRKIREEDQLDAITITDFVIAREIKKAIPQLKLECSSLAYIDSIQKAKYWESIGTDIIVFHQI